MTYPLIPAAEVQILETDSILKAMETINSNDAKIALVVNKSGKLLGSLTDGDIRRGLLKGLTLASHAREVMHSNPFAMLASSSREEIFVGMHKAQVKQVPLLDSGGKLLGIVLYDMITGFLRVPRANHVVIMAGGKGKRLLPFTRDIPKPMMAIGGRPMLAHIIQQFVTQGFSHFHIAVNYLGHLIEEYFGDGSMLDCQIEYIREEESLGTAGALSLITKPFADPFILMNGDILSSVNFGEILDYHSQNQAVATVCARMHRMEVPFGVIQLKDNQLEAIVEKPVYENLISAGIYALSPEVVTLVAKDILTDMPTLLQRLVEQQKKVAVFPLRDNWMDVGRPDDLTTATQAFDGQAS